MEPLIRDAISQLLGKGVSIAEVADALGVTEQQVGATLAESPGGFLEEVPGEWHVRLAELAWEQGGLEALVRSLERA